MIELKELYLDDLEKITFLWPDGTELKSNSKSVFVATNREIELARLCGGVGFKNRKEKQLYLSLSNKQANSEEYRKKVAIEQLGYTEEDFNTEEYKKYANWKYDK